MKHRYRRLPKPLYHGTTCDNAKRILKEGLSKECAGVHDESFWPAGVAYIGPKKRMAKCGIYLTEYDDRAFSYAFEATCPEWDIKKEEGDTDKACVLKVRCLDKKARVGPDGFGDLMTDKNIPSDCIEELSVKERKRLGLTNLYKLAQTGRFQ